MQAPSYRLYDQTLEPRTDVDLVIELQPQPIPIDSLSVRARTIALRGHVVEASTGRRLADAAVFLGTSQLTSSSAAGSFELDGLMPGDTFQVLVEALGYLPVEYTVAPTTDSIRVFEMRPDSLALKLIDAQISRLEERSAGMGYARIQVDRDEIMESMVATPAHLIRERLGLDVASIRCVFVDEQQRRFGFRDLEGYALDRIHRIEIIDRGAIVRVYTTHFIEQMLAGRVMLTPIVLVPGTRSSICG